MMRFVRASEQKLYLYELHEALTRVVTEDVATQDVESNHRALDDACRGWLGYRASILRKDPSVDELELSVRVANVFQNQGIYRVSELRKLKFSDFEKMGLKKAHYSDTREALAYWDTKHRTGRAR